VVNSRRDSHRASFRFGLELDVPGSRVGEHCSLELAHVLALFGLLGDEPGRQRVLRYVRREAECAWWSRVKDEGGYPTPSVSRARPHASSYSAHRPTSNDSSATPLSQPAHPASASKRPSTHTRRSCAHLPQTRLPRGRTTARSRRL